jgi:arginyl-tRNA synthetase
MMSTATATTVKSLLSTLTDIFSDAFQAAGLDRTYGDVVVSQRADLGQFQCNGALAAAKEQKQNPRAVAQLVLDNLPQREIFAELSLAGPGFINIILTDDYLAGYLNRIAADERLSVEPVAEPKNVLVDYGGANVAKSMHVGHLRSAIIGESIKRVFRFMGDNVLGDVHLGDWGLQMGQLIVELKRERPDLPYFDPDFTGPYPEESPVTIRDLEVLYPQGSKRAKEDPEVAEAARQATMELQQHRPGYFALWRHFVNVSIVELKRDYGKLGVNFDLWLGESDVQDRLPAMIDGLRQQGHVESSQGAEVIYLPPQGEEKELNPLILVKSDGGVMYGTTDLGTIEQRVKDYNVDQILYVVDARQAYHFQQVFRAARLTGIATDVDMEHVGFGTMNGADGKPFKTREGGTMKLSDLIAMGVEEATKRMAEAGIAQDYPEEEKEEIARKVGIAAVKYADLMNHRTSDYLFDLEKFTRFEGRTGAYLLYAAVRIKSVLRKAAERDFEPGEIIAPDDRSRELALMLTGLPEAVRLAYDKRAPNFLSEFVYNLAQSFSRFYDKCHILSEENAALRASWLGLVNLCLREFELVLDLLGIEIPERM